jgi:predicted lipoprotein with Yx(FWY)xxD motif
MNKLLIGAVVVMGSAASCGGAATTSSSPAGGGSGSGTTIATGSTPVGSVLTSAQGFTLYYLTTEKGGVDKCTNLPGCSAVWPGLAPPSGGSPTAASGVTGQLSVLSTSTGGMEVSYNGWPLHTFAMDTQAGQANGQGITSFGGTWFAATPGLTAAGGGSSASSTSSRYGY